MPVEPVAQPAVELAELARLELRLEIGNRALDVPPDLNRDRVPERVGREVAVRGARPVHVLEDAARVVGNLDAEQIEHAGVPRLRQLLQRQRALHQPLLELEAEDDVERVGDLVGLDPDQPRRDAVDPAVERLQVDRLERRKPPLQLGQEAPPERQRATDRFSQSRLCDSPSPSDGAAGERRPLERGIAPLVRESVPALVHRRPDRAQVVRPVARRHPDVRARERGRERMHRRIEPPGALLEAEPRQHLLEELLLGRDRVVAVQERVVGGLAGVAHDRRQLRTEHVEDGSNLGRRHPRLVLVEEGVVGRVARLLALGPAERDLVDAPNAGRKTAKSEAARASSQAACAFELSREPGRRELGRHAPRLVPVAPHDPEQARVVRVVVELRRQWLGALEQPPDLVGDEALVDDPAERRERLRAGGRALRRHRRPLIPAQHAERPLEIVDLREAQLQLGEGVVHREEPNG